MTVVAQEGGKKEGSQREQKQRERERERERLNNGDKKGGGGGDRGGGGRQPSETLKIVRGGENYVLSCFTVPQNARDFGWGFFPTRNFIFTRETISLITFTILGATKEIRDAISNPSVEMETKAWTALQPSVRAT